MPPRRGNGNSNGNSNGNGNGDSTMARSIWTGSISFGLVSIPIKVHTAVRDKGVHLHMLTPDGKCRLRRKLVCPDSGKAYDFENTARGYEVAPDQYVLVSDEEIDSIRPESGRMIELTEFVQLDDIDPMFFERPYHLAPDDRGAKAYQLLYRAMADKGRVAIGRMVMRQKQYLVALRPHDGVIIMETMRYADDLVDAAKELDLPANVEVSTGELKMAEQLIEAMTSDRFDPDQYRDEYRERLMSLIDQKAEGEELVVHEPAEDDVPQVINLMEALQKSLAGAKKQTGKQAKKKPARRKSA
jgi:DNA end-binding protein Ku